MAGYSLPALVERFLHGIRNRKRRHRAVSRVSWEFWLRKNDHYCIVLQIKTLASHIIDYVKLTNTRTEKQQITTNLILIRSPGSNDYVFCALGRHFKTLYGYDATVTARHFRPLFSRHFWINPDAIATRTTTSLAHVPERP